MVANTTNNTADISSTNLPRIPKRIFLRREQTPQEIILWSRLRRNQLGFKFKRQFSVGPYILDFYSPQIKLAIELDGSQHFEFENSQNDIRRDEVFAYNGIQILRYPNIEITSNLKSVLEDIYFKVQSSIAVS